MHIGLTHGMQIMNADIHKNGRFQIFQGGQGKHSELG